MKLRKRALVLSRAVTSASPTLAGWSQGVDDASEALPDCDGLLADCRLVVGAHPAQHRAEHVLDDVVPLERAVTGDVRSGEEVLLLHRTDDAQRGDLYRWWRRLMVDCRDEHPVEGLCDESGEERVVWDDAPEEGGAGEKR